MTTSLLFPPALVLVAGAFALPFLRGGARSVALLGLPLVTIWLVWSLPEGAQFRAPFLGYELIVAKVDNLSRLFAIVFAIMVFSGALFALNQPRTLELSAAFAYAGSAIGAVMAGDLISLFIYWELMAIGSAIVVFCGIRGAERAAFRYAALHLLGGALLMAGIAGEVQASGSISFNKMDTSTLSRWLILAGFLINAGAPPFSAWLPDAYPQASWSGMVFLSAFTTKTAVYVLIRGFPGTELLIWIGLFMVFYGIVYAILENDMRRILAYSIVNQVGFMVVGIGIGTEMALNGAAAHAFTHIVYKALLLMSAGSVLLMTGKSKCTDLGGLFRTMPLTCLCGIIGALAISSFPLTSGFVSKSMIAEGAADSHLMWVWLALAAASAGVFLHAGIKFPWFVFFQQDSGLRPAEPPVNMRAAMILLAALCIGIGILPGPLYALLPFPVDYVPYTGSHVVFQSQLLLFSGLAFFLLLPLLKRTLTITLDTDWFWRRAGSWLLRRLDSASGRAWDAVVRGVLGSAHTLTHGFRATHGPEGVLGRPWPTGRMALWTVMILGAYLVVAYL